MDCVASKAHVAQRSKIEEQAIFSFPFCLFVIFVVVVVIVVLRFKASGAMFWERIRRKSRAGKKNETYALK